MKFVRYGATAVVLGVACLTRAGADPASPSTTPVTSSSGNSTTPAATGTSTTDLSKTMLLPETDSPLEIQPSAPAPASNLDAAASATAEETLDNREDLPPVRAAVHKPTQDEINAYLQKQAEAEQDKDWLMRGYEQQLQSRLGNTSEDQGTNLYYQLATNKDLAKLAGLSTLEPPVVTPIVAPRTGVTDSDKGALVLRKDPSQESGKSGAPNIAVFKPLINPEGPVFDSTSNNPYTALSYDASRLFPPDSSTTADSTEKTSDVSVPTDIETPGLVAAKNDPLAADIAADLSDGLSQPATLPQDPSMLDSLPTLSPSTATAQLQKNDALALNVPGSLKITEPQPLANPVIFKLPDNADPVVKVIQPNPVRRAIASPLDIPYH